MSTEAPGARQARGRSRRARIVLALGPLAVLAGIAWAAAQPYRVTFLDPSGRGFWWLAVQPPLLVVVVGALFALLVAPGLVRDLEERGSE